MDRQKLSEKFNVTEEQLDAWAKEYEEGTWKGRLGEVTMGRPRIYDEDLETISFRLPVSRINAIEAVTTRKGKSRSEFLREAVDMALIASAKEA
ncbi:MAG TPA: toxin-antitoxin system antitoxin subunit [Coriobacteriia bacterium]|nr:toxin-antitoxin system antitoxin subunit [Coriobacteriia bacterium]